MPPPLRIFFGDVIENCLIFQKTFKINFVHITKNLLKICFYRPEIMSVVDHLHVTNQLFFSVIQREIGKMSVTENLNPIPA